MRIIHVADEVRLRFPGRDEQFDQGVEIGVIATLIEFGVLEFSRPLGHGTMDQARSLAGSLGYRVVEEPAEEDGYVTATFCKASMKPQLRLVSSNG
jgi:hypothetical protein